jgi:hypothetical protein
VLLKDWGRIRTILKSRGVEGTIREPVLTPYDIDAMEVNLAACLNIERRAEVVGDEKEGRLVVPKMDRSDLQQ